MKSVDSVHSHLRLSIGSFSIEILDNRIDSGQSYLRLRIGSFSIEFLKKNIDSGHSYLRLRIGSFSIEHIKKSIDSGQSYLRFRIGQSYIRIFMLATETMPSLQNITETNGNHLNDLNHEFPNYCKLMNSITNYQLDNSQLFGK